MGGTSAAPDSIHTVRDYLSTGVSMKRVRGTIINAVACKSVIRWPQVYVSILPPSLTGRSTARRSS